MAHPSPGKLRSPRSRALEIGTTPAGFVEGPEYDARGGHPVTAETPRQDYDEQMPAVSGGGAPINQPSPFKLGG